jgi:hypothetical protein
MCLSAKFSARRKGILLGLLFLGALTGCTQIVPKEQEPTLQTETSAKTIVPNKTLVPTETVEALQKTPSLIVSAKPLPHDFAIQAFCPAVDHEVSEFSDLPGTLVFASDYGLTRENILTPKSEKDYTLSFWNPASDEIISYGQIGYIYAESPDKEKIATTQAKTLDISSDLVVLNNQAEEYGRIEFPEDWTFFTWLNNEQLLFRQYRSTKDISKEEYDLVVIDLSTQEQQIFSSDFPNIYLQEVYFTWGSPVSFHSNSNIVVYHQIDYEINQIISVFWDMEKNEPITKIIGGYWIKWSPDGSKILLTSDVEEDYERFNEIYLFDNATNELTQVSFFKEHYEASFIELPVWSPDNRFVAFWLRIDGFDEPYKLAVLDTEMLTVDIFCHEIDPWPFRFGSTEWLLFQEIQVNSTSPIWSPDSKYLLVEDSKKGESKTLLVDIQNNTVVKIADQARPVAWLK